MQPVKQLWSTWRRVDPGLSLAGYIYALLLSTTLGAAVIAWLSTTWEHYWLTYKWAGVAFAFVCAWLAFTLGIFFIGAGVARWRRGADPVPRPESSMVELQSDDKFYPPTVTISPPTLERSLYVADIRFTFGELEKDRHSELTMRVFNGSGRVVKIGTVSGQIKFNAPNDTDPSRMGDLPPPTLRHDTARTAVQLEEWFLIFAQRVPGAEADKLLAMLKAEIPIHFDLTGLNVEVFPDEDQDKIERLPIWGGVSYSHGNGFGRIINLVVRAQIGVSTRLA